MEMRSSFPLARTTTDARAHSRGRLARRAPFFGRGEACLALLLRPRIAWDKDASALGPRLRGGHAPLTARAARRRLDRRRGLAGLDHAADQPLAQHCAGL